MNKIIVFVAAALIFALGAVVYKYLHSSRQPGMLPKAIETIPTSRVDTSKITSRYAKYSPEVFASFANTRRVLFFYAAWCPTCQPADESFNQNMGQIPADTSVIRVNYNDSDTDQQEKDLAKKYGITYQHTFVQVDTAGQEIAKWNGGQIEELLSRLK